MLFQQSDIFYPRFLTDFLEDWDSYCITSTLTINKLIYLVFKQHEHESAWWCWEVRRCWQDQCHVTKVWCWPGPESPPFPGSPLLRQHNQHNQHFIMREIVHIQAGQCGNQIGAKVRLEFLFEILIFVWSCSEVSQPRLNIYDSSTHCTATVVTSEAVLGIENKLFYIRILKNIFFAKSKRSKIKEKKRNFWI